MSDAPDPCYLAALRILNYRFNSEGELRRKLRAKKFEKDAIDSTIARLHKERWLDDERFAGAFVRTRANKGIGKLRIVRELQAAGIDQSAAQEAVTANVEPESEREALLELGRKRARMLVRRHGDAFLSTADGRNKLAGYLLKQGYDAALVREAVRQVLREIHG